MISFETIDLRNICEDGNLAEKQLGSSVAYSLKLRLADIQAATGIADILVGNPRITQSAEFGDCFVVDVGADISLEFAANHPDGSDGGVGNTDWTKVTRLKLLRMSS